MFSAVKIHSDSLFVYNSGLCGYLAKRLVHGIIHCRQVLSKSLTCLKGKHADANAPRETTLRRLHRMLELKQVSECLSVCEGSWTKCHLDERLLITMSENARHVEVST